MRIDCDTPIIKRARMRRASIKVYVDGKYIGKECDWLDPQNNQAHRALTDESGELYVIEGKDEIAGETLTGVITLEIAGKKIDLSVVNNK